MWGRWECSSPLDRSEVRMGLQPLGQLPWAGDHLGMSPSAMGFFSLWPHRHLPCSPRRAAWRPAGTLLGRLFKPQGDMSARPPAPATECASYGISSTRGPGVPAGTKQRGRGQPLPAPPFLLGEKKRDFVAGICRWPGGVAEGWSQRQRLKRRGLGVGTWTLNESLGARSRG